ncbi:hypothetical protein DL98DRAFT_158303 [Cadophora sp. DSE1049]|nr:hypothetical protein DL98DRAFT_158303 [Cadophora sp. DSE1049]
MLEVIDQEYFILPLNGYSEIILPATRPERQQLLQNLKERYTNVAALNRTVQEFITVAEEDIRFACKGILRKAQHLDFRLQKQILDIRVCAFHGSEARYLRFLPYLRNGALEIQDQAFSLQSEIDWTGYKGPGLGKSTLHFWKLLLLLMDIAKLLHLKAQAPPELSQLRRIYHYHIDFRERWIQHQRRNTKPNQTWSCESRQLRRATYHSDVSELWIQHQRRKNKHTRHWCCASYYVPAKIEPILESSFEYTWKLCPVSSSKQQLCLATMDELLRRRGTQDV